jgi:general stress protein YciG
MLAKGGAPMTEKEFQTNMRAAKTFQGLTSISEEQQFWTGYQRGIRRHYHGDNFGTAEEHEKWISLIDDPTREMMGLGYWVGSTGQDIQVAMKTLTKKQYMAEIGRKGGSVSSEKKTRAVRKNAHLGGRPRKKVSQTSKDNTSSSSLTRS